MSNPTEDEMRARAERLFLVQPSTDAVEIMRRQTAEMAGMPLDELLRRFEGELAPLRGIVERRDYDAAFCVIGPLVTTALAMLGRCLAETCIEAAKEAMGGYAKPRES